MSNTKLTIEEIKTAQKKLAEFAEKERLRNEWFKTFSHQLEEKKACEYVKKSGLKCHKNAVEFSSYCSGCKQLAKKKAETQRLQHGRKLDAMQARLNQTMSAAQRDHLKYMEQVKARDALQRKTFEDIAATVQKKHAEALQKERKSITEALQTTTMWDPVAY